MTGNQLILLPRAVDAPAPAGVSRAEPPEEPEMDVLDLDTWSGKDLGSLSIFACYECEVKRYTSTPNYMLMHV